MLTRRLLAFGVPALCFVGLAAIACFGPDSRAVVPSTRAAEASQSFDLRPEEKQLVEVFKEVSPSVVFVSSNVVRRNYFDFSLEEIARGSGSGFIWDKQGHVVTNYHVIRDFVESGGRSMRLTVTLADRSEYRVAKIVGTYMDKELAVLEIDAPPEKLRPIRVGRSSALSVGQTVLAIGNPFGLDHSLTTGIVSALGREIQALTGRRIADVIQTDAAINPGNSGGPLLNSAGQLIGMNTAILSPSGAYAGIGFAIPGDTVQRFVEQLIRNNGKIVSPGLGVALFPDYVTQRLGIPGVLINKIPSDSAAAKSGLRGTRFYEDGELEQLGDMITAVDGKKVTDFNSLRDALEARGIGDEVEVTYTRDKEERKTRLRLQKIEIER